jgi:hypothetical protein
MTADDLALNKAGAPFSTGRGEWWDPASIANAFATRKPAQWHDRAEKEV